MDLQKRHKTSQEAILFKMWKAYMDEISNMRNRLHLLESPMDQWSPARHIMSRQSDKIEIRMEHYVQLYMLNYLDQEKKESVADYLKERFKQKILG